MSKDRDETNQRPWPDYCASSEDKAPPAAGRKTNGQFAKGTSGNPKGRPRKRQRSFLPRQFVSDILAITEEIISIKTERGVEKVPAIEVGLKQLRRKAMSGHGPSLGRFIDLHFEALVLHAEKHAKHFKSLDEYETYAVFNGEGSAEFIAWLNGLRKATRRT